MPLEFRCGGCERLLRVPDDASGRQAACPACGMTMTVPTPQRSWPEPTPAAPRGTDQPTAASSTPSATEPAENPYKSPSAYVPGVPPVPGVWHSRHYAAGRVAGPATWLIVTGVVGLPIKLLGILGCLIALGGMGRDLGREWNGAVNDPLLMLGGEVGLAVEILGFFLCIVVILGAVRMKGLNNYGLAMAAAIIAMIPRISPCCLLGLPFGIWALIVLSDALVKDAFRR